MRRGRIIRYGRREGEGGREGGVCMNLCEGGTICLCRKPWGGSFVAVHGHSVLFIHRFDRLDLLESVDLTAQTEASSSPSLSHPTLQHPHLSLPPHHRWTSSAFNKPTPPPTTNAPFAASSPPPPLPPPKLDLGNRRRQRPDSLRRGPQRLPLHGPRPSPFLPPAPPCSCSCGEVLD